jgi:signal transduction histidine kinase
VSTTEIVDQSVSTEFIYTQSFIPLSPLIKLYVSTMLLALYLFNILTRENFDRLKNPAWLFTSFVLEIAISLSLIYFTNLSYRGILLLTIANVFFVSEISWHKVFFSFWVILLYVFCDYDLLSQYTDVVSIGTYINYLAPTIRINFYVIKNLLFSCNDVLFFTYMIYWVQSQIKEKSKISKLYEQQFRANKELELAYVQLEHYLEKSEETTKMRERNRFAREIHDTIGHSLTAIISGLDACKELLDDKLHLTNQLEKLGTVSKELLCDVRRSVKQLRPDSLDKLSLFGAIQKLASDITTLTNTTVRFNYSSKRHINADQENVIYRVIQECITNSVKHGQATLIEVSLQVDQDKIHLLIQDDGIGCTNITEGSGLLNIRERIAETGGHVNFLSINGFSTDVEIQLPEEKK